MRPARWVFGEVVVGMSKAGAVHQQLEIDDAKGATSTRWLVRSEVPLHLEGIGVAPCLVAESSLMGSSYTAGVAEAAVKVPQVEEFAALGESRLQKVVPAAVRALMVALAVTEKCKLCFGLSVSTHTTVLGDCVNAGGGEERDSKTCVYKVQTT
jgi:hypothetical protein